MKLSPFFSLVPLAVALVLSACSVPKVSMPKIPFISGGDGPRDVVPPADDPLVPFDPRKPLTYGHTLQLTVYSGSFNPSKIYAGRVMVDRDGTVTFKRVGQVKIGGLTLAKAAVAIEDAFAAKGNTSVMQAQIEKVENTPIVMISGAVRSPGAVQWYEGQTLANVLPAVGGHDASPGHAVYVVRHGTRHFHESADDTPLEPGDIITFSSDL
jgi:protein involved in polysaccharide export with SLBB domain